MLLRDYNCDGKKDIFTAHPFGVAVFVNTTALQGGKFSWRAFNQGESLMTMGFTAPVNLKVNLSDIPSINDIDGDGDLDILNVRTSGNTTLEFHQNQTMELNHNCDTMQFVRTTQRWGGVEDCNCGKFEFKGISCFGGRIQHTGGKAILATDIDLDGDPDLLYADEYCTAMYLLRNEGSFQVPEFNTVEAFVEPDFPFFPAPYLEDINADGVLDFIAASNFSSRVYETDFAASVWKYSKSLSGSFVLNQPDFLQHDMIDVGDDAAPAFADADGDGDQDMFIGTNTGLDQSGSIWFFENTGSFGAPEFKLITKNYAELSLLPLTNIKPMFVDITGDEKRDLVFSATSTETAKPGIYYFENQSATSLIFSGSVQTIAFDLLWDEKIFLTDFNRDGMMDILKGNYYGAVQLWLNNGDFHFILTNKLDYLGSGLNRTSPSLFVTDVNDDGLDDLLVGDQTGYLKMVSDYKSGKFTQQDVLVLNEELEEYVPMKLAGRLFPTAVRLNLASAPSIIAGTSSGGLVFLTPEAHESPTFNFHLYPNPIPHSAILHISSNANGNFLITDLLGRIVSKPLRLDAGQTYDLESVLPPGVYLAKVNFEHQSIVKRIIVK
jgi:hypothetical protein